MVFRRFLLVTFLVAVVAALDEDALPMPSFVPPLFRILFLLDVKFFLEFFESLVQHSVGLLLELIHLDDVVQSQVKTHEYQGK